jgi:hypothetical protein
MKVQVYSSCKEVRACTGRTWDGEGNAHLQFRKFEAVGPKSTEGKAYMTPQEAKFLVESDYVRNSIEMGFPAPFRYPMGYPIPVANDHDGPLAMPITEGSFHVSDARQLEQAQQLIKERDEAIAAAKAAKEEAESAGSGGESTDATTATNGGKKSKAKS